MYLIKINLLMLSFSDLKMGGNGKRKHYNKSRSKRPRKKYELQSLHKSNRVFKCLSVPKDNAHCWIDIVLLYNVAYHKSSESF